MIRTRNRVEAPESRFVSLHEKSPPSKSQKRLSGEGKSVSKERAVSPSPSSAFIGASHSGQKPDLPNKAAPLGAEATSTEWSGERLPVSPRIACYALERHVR